MTKKREANGKSEKPNESDNSIQIKRLNYIGSKYQLLDWLVENIKEQTGISDLNNVCMGDLFAGTGIVTYRFRKEGAIVIANDAELYSSCIAQAFNTGTYSDNVETAILTINALLESQNWDEMEPGYITKNYSPYDDCERMFFTVNNAKKIDFVRRYLDSHRANYSDDEYNFLLASLLVSADAVGNVAAVYGCYLKKFKATAKKDLRLIPIHTDRSLVKSESKTTHKPVEKFYKEEDTMMDIAYIDPPYNERQYSKNYFPLNQITKSPSVLENEELLTGKTGIPVDCYSSPFCRKRTALSAFEDLIKNVNSEYVFISYNTEGIVAKNDFIRMMEPYGTVSVVERTYKRFKSYQYNEDKEIQELLFCLHKVV